MDQITLTEGLPKFRPLAAKYGGRSAWHGNVSPKAAFVWIEKSDSAAEAFWLLQRSDTGSSLAELSLLPVGDHLEGRHQTQPGRTLQIRLDRKNRLLHYVWVDEATSYLSKGQKVPDADLGSLDGNAFSLSDMRGRWIVLNWWSVTCAPCREEIPGLNRLVEKKAASDIVFLAVSPDDPATLRGFLTKYPFQYRQSFAGEEWMQTLGEQFPRHLVIAPDGTVAADLVGGSEDVDHVLGDLIDRVRKP